MASLLKSIKYLRKTYQSLQDLFKNRGGRCFPICFMRAVKLDKELIRKRYRERPISLINVDTKNLTDYQQIKSTSTQRGEYIMNK